jgi:hypothetical protein
MKFLRVFAADIVDCFAGGCRGCERRYYDGSRFRRRCRYGCEGYCCRRGWGGGWKRAVIFVQAVRFDVASSKVKTITFS